MTAADLDTTPHTDHQTAHATPRVILDAPAGGWPDRLDASTSAPVRRFRAELGLPVDRAIVMSGHQPGLWHAGIAAKVFATDALAKRFDAHAAWLVIDLDTNDPFAIDLPTRSEPTHDAHAPLERTPWRCTSTPTTTAVPAFQPAQPPDAATPFTREDPTLHPIADRLRHALDAVEQAAHNAPSAAMQMTEAALKLLPRVDHAPAVLTVTASALSQTTLFANLIAAMRTDPSLAHNAYNAGVDHAPDSGVRRLRHDAARGPELPVWLIDTNGRRRAAYADDLATHDASEFAPRGMLTTAMMRLAGCELFLHGTGGRAYEPINDHWFANWDGIESALDATSEHKVVPQQMAPFAIASADLLLDLGGPPVTRAEAADAVWRAHHARHHPRLLGDDDAQRIRDELTSRIKAAPRGSHERAALFADLHAVLAKARSGHRGALDTIAEQRDSAVRALAEHDLRTDRTWSIALHPPERLATLRDAIASELGTKLKRLSGPST